MIYTIGKKEFMSTIRSGGIYFTMFFSFMIISIGLYFFTENIKNSVFILSRTMEPLSLIFMISVVGIFSLYFATNSVTTIARERHDKTLEVLFYGPIDEFSFIIGKFTGMMFVFLFMLLCSLAFILLVDLFVHIGNFYEILKLSFLSIFLISCIITLGIFLSIFTSSVSGSISLLIGFFIALTVLQIMGGIIDVFLGDNQSISMIKDTIMNLISNVKYISPIEYLSMGWDSIASKDNTKYLLSLLYSLIYSGVFLGLSTVALIKRGVKQ